MFQTIVVGTDGSTGALTAVRIAAELAKAANGVLHIVTAVRDVPDMLASPEVAMAVPTGWADSVRASAQTAVDDAMAVAKEVGANGEGHVVGGEPSDALVRACEQLEADLLVVGNRGMTGVGRFLLGSVPNRCAHHAPCSVLIAHTSA